MADGRWVVAFAGALAIAGLAGAPGSASAQSCDRRCLTRVMDGYMARLVTHDPKGLPLAAGVENRENTRKLRVGDGLWKLAATVKERQTFSDPITGNVVSWNALQLTTGQLAMVSVRLKVGKGKITEIETVANSGGNAANPGGSPYPGGPYNAENIAEQDIIYMAPVPPHRRSSRAELIRLADNYFEAIGAHDPSVFKYGAKCERYESGARGTNQMRRNADQSAAQGNFSGDCGSSLVNLRGQQTINRRYPVVDTELGVVIGYMFIMHRERTPPADNMINEMFKIVDGKVRQIDAVGYFLPGVGDSGFLDDPKVSR
jgi:hypothetical protein